MDDEIVLKIPAKDSEDVETSEEDTEEEGSEEEESHVDKDWTSVFQEEIKNFIHENGLNYNVCNCTEVSQILSEKEGSYLCSCWTVLAFAHLWLRGF